MSDYHKTLRKHRRLAILEFLERCAGYTSNSALLTDVLNSDRIGIGTSHDQTASELAWLEEMGLITLAGDPLFQVATATARGTDIALGRATHPDIQRPGARP